MTDLERTATGHDDGIRRVARVCQVVLVYAPQPVEVRSRLLQQGVPITIGRDPGEVDALQLPDQEASRRHAVIACALETGAWTIRDLGSRNGLFVDGVATRDASLHDGAVIRIGGTLMVFVAADIAPDAYLEPEDEHLLGASVRMQLVRGEIAQVAPRMLPVLLAGPSGTGKECAARSIHARSGRRGPLVAVNCAAITPSVAESELFGHVAGAFTGATAQRDGLFVAAKGGTLFLDEVGDLPLDLQAKLLRALSAGDIRPVGSTESLTVDVRVVAASLVDLAAAVAANEFRGDLFARLAGWTIRMPPLEARREDVLALATVRLAHHGSARLSPGAAEALLVYGWPYNVRELHHVLDVAVVRAKDGVIRVEHLPDPIGAPLRERAGERAPPAAIPLALLVDRTVPQPSAGDLRKVLEHFRGSVALAAGFYNRDRKQMYRWLERYGLEPDEFR